MPSPPAILAAPMPPATSQGLPASSNGPPANQVAIPDDTSDSPSMSRSMHNMVSDLVDPPTDTAVSWSPTPTPGGAISPRTTSTPVDLPMGKASNILTASELLTTLPYSTPIATPTTYPYPSLPRSGKSSAQHTPRPSLPSIYNTPFAPQPDEEASAPGSPSQFAQLQPPPTQQQQISSSSSASAMPPPSSCIFPDTPGLKPASTTTTGHRRNPSSHNHIGNDSTTVYSDASAFDDMSNVDRVVAAGGGWGVIGAGPLAAGGGTIATPAASSMPPSPYWTSSQFASVARGKGVGGFRHGSRPSSGGPGTPMRSPETPPPGGEAQRARGFGRGPRGVGKAGWKVG